jgi:hypothetical protein
MAFNTIFPSSLGTVLKALKGYISKEKSDFQSYNNHDKRLDFFINQQMNITVPENMVYSSPENMKKAGHPRHPVVHGGLPSGPRQITQRFTTKSNHKSNLRRHQLRPMTKEVTKRMRQG